MSNASHQASGDDAATSDRLPAELAGLEVVGLNLAPGRFIDALGEEPTLLVFLRQLGCIFCHETVTDLRRLSEKESRLPKVLFLHPATQEQGAEFFAEHWPEARVIADPQHRFYHAFGLDKTRFWQRYGPLVVAGAARAFLRGSRQGKAIGHENTQPGVALMRGERVLHVWKGQRVSDRPKFDAMAGPSS
jgi:hypothetical protein